MGTHYLDITLVPEPELTPSHLLGALFDHLHLTLVQEQACDVGVSFPGYRLKPRTLGDVLRLHGNEQALARFTRTDWLKGMRDHVRLAHIAPIPADAMHRWVQRKQFKTNAARMRRRRMRRKSETAEQATAAIPVSVERKPDLPYLHIHSRSTRQPFCLFIAMGPPQPNATSGTYNRYGLSGSATVPWF